MWFHKNMLSLVILGVITSTTKHHYQGLRAASVACAHEGIYVFELIKSDYKVHRVASDACAHEGIILLWHALGDIRIELYIRARTAQQCMSMQAFYVQGSRGCLGLRPGGLIVIELVIARFEGLPRTLAPRRA